jgi:hypothetical protein
VDTELLADVYNSCPLLFLCSLSRICSSSCPIDVTSRKIYLSRDITNHAITQQILNNFDVSWDKPLFSSSFEMLSPSIASSRDLTGNTCSDSPWVFSFVTDAVLDFEVSHWFARSGVPCYIQGA